MPPKEAEKLVRYLEEFYDDILLMKPAGLPDYFVGDTEAEAAKHWTAVELYLMAKVKSGKQHIRIIDAETWWKKGDRKGKLTIVIQVGKVQRFYAVEIFPVTGRMLQFEVNTKFEDPPVRAWRARAVSFPNGGKWKIERLPRDARDRSVSGI